MNPIAPLPSPLNDAPPSPLSPPATHKLLRPGGGAPPSCPHPCLSRRLPRPHPGAALVPPRSSDSFDSFLSPDLPLPLLPPGRHAAPPPPDVTPDVTQDPLLLRVARGEDAERTPVWLMRQAGRYMAAFRECVSPPHFFCFVFCLFGCFFGVLHSQISLLSHSFSRGAPRCRRAGEFLPPGGGGGWGWAV